jgi:nucleoside 2-deoxyribosyltransferase
MTKTKSKPIHYDVFLSHSVRDEALATVVKQKLADAGLSVFGVSGLDLADGGEPGAEFGDAVLKALVDSSALVALLTPAHRDSPALGVEVGAAWAQRKPVYVLVEGEGAAAVPSYLRRFQVYPLSEIARVIPAIARVARPFPEAR